MHLERFMPTAPNPGRRRPAVWLAALASAAALLLASCASAPISPEVMGQVNKQIGMEQLKADPAAYVGQAVLLGGRIIATRNLPKTTEIEILHLPLGDDDRPKEGDLSQGRFLAVMPGYADAAVYAPGRYVTVAGRVSGSTLRPVGQIEYRYPVLEVLQAHLWQRRAQDGYPNVVFGLGVGTAF
jgi:outer membrane lipoprotein